MSVGTLDAQTLARADAAGPASVAAATPRHDHSDVSIRPYRIEVPEAALLDLRRRIAATRWPERETVSDQTQGVPLAKLQALVAYWGTDYDWRKVEATLNALPHPFTIHRPPTAANS